MKVFGSLVVILTLIYAIFSTMIWANDKSPPEKVVASVLQAELSHFKKEYRRPHDIPFPEENPYSKEKAELGKLLFFDPRLSGSNAISCASCHNPGFAWEDIRATSLGEGAVVLGRHTPTILNLAWGELYFWDGRAESMEEQALGPIQSDVEMAQNIDDLVTELKSIPEYQVAFKNVFASVGITPETIGKAIATFERTIVSGEAPFDHWVNGDDDAISESAKRGFVLFNTKAKCSECHTGWNFTDWGFHDIGIDDDDLGRFVILDIDVLKHSFKTPGLRNITNRSPYMHNGSMFSLAEVIDHYDVGFIERPSLSTTIVKLGLSQREKIDLLAFLETLSSKDPVIQIGLLPN